jgi:hypothetical protein
MLLALSFLFIAKLIYFGLYFPSSVKEGKNFEKRFQGQKSEPVLVKETGFFV